MTIKRLISTVLTVAACMTIFSTTAFAQVKTMPDGTQFDAEYYASQNPDVVAALGNSEAALYQHYVQHGKAEGRAPVANGNNAASASNSVKESVNALGITYDPSRDSSVNLAGFTQRPLGREFTRADYTSDPLYYEFAKEFVSNKGFISFKDYVGDTYFGDKDLTYLNNVVSNLYVDYVESKLGGNAQAVNGGLSGLGVCNDLLRSLGAKWNYKVDVKLPN